MPPLNLYARVRFLCALRTRDRGCSAHPAFLRPLRSEGKETRQTSGEQRRENADPRLPGLPGQAGRSGTLTRYRQPPGLP